MKKKVRLKKKNLFLLLLFIIFICSFIYSGIYILKYFQDNHQNKEIKDNINKLIKIKDDEYIIDFKELKKQNPDTVGYLKVLNTNIDYIVVKTTDNSYYLKHNFNKEYNISGWIFADYRNMIDGLDKNLIIYGHSTKDNSMFGTLKDTLESTWQNNKDNHIITFVTEDGTYLYQVFSTYIIEPEDYYIETSFKTTEEYNIFLNTLLKRSNYDYETTISENDKIITLSSCNINGTKRIVLHGKLIDFSNS